MPDEIQPIPVGEPEVVYLYTTMDTMVKIVTSGKIWATSISYLNDSSEGEHWKSRSTTGLRILEMDYLELAG